MVELENESGWPSPPRFSNRLAGVIIYEPNGIHTKGTGMLASAGKAANCPPQAVNEVEYLRPANLVCVEAIGEDAELEISTKRELEIRQGLRLALVSPRQNKSE